MSAVSVKMTGLIKFTPTSFASLAGMSIVFVYFVNKTISIHSTTMFEIRSFILLNHLHYFNTRHGFEMALQNKYSILLSVSWIIDLFVCVIDLSLAFEAPNQIMTEADTKIFLQKVQSIRCIHFCISSGSSLSDCNNLMQRN